MHPLVHPQVYPWLHCQVDHQLQLSSHFCVYCVLPKVKSYVRFQVQDRLPPQVHFFIKSLCVLLCTNKSTTMCMFKCNSIVISKSSSMLTSNASLVHLDIYIDLEVHPSVSFQINLQWHPQMNWQMHPQVHHIIKCNAKCITFVVFLCIFHGSSKLTLKCNFKRNIKSIKCTF